MTWRRKPTARRLPLTPELWQALMGARILVHSDGRVELVHLFSQEVGYAVELPARFARRLRPALEQASAAVGVLQDAEDAQRRELRRQGH